MVFQLLDSFVKFFLVGFLEDFLGFFGSFSFEGDVLLVPVEFGPFVAWRSFLLGSLMLRILLFLLLLLRLSLLVDLLLVFYLLRKGFGRVNETLFNVFLWDVFRHEIKL